MSYLREVGIIGLSKLSEEYNQDKLKSKASKLVEEIISGQIEMLPQNGFETNLNQHQFSDLQFPGANNDDLSMTLDQDDPLNEMLEKAERLAAQIRAPVTLSDDLKDSCSHSFATGHDSVTFAIDEPRTPVGVIATVSLDSEDDVESMLLKADILSRSMRSAANGELDTPELLRASDKFLRIQNSREESSPLESTPHLLSRAKKIFEHTSKPNDLSHFIENEAEPQKTPKHGTSNKRISFAMDITNVEDESFVTLREKEDKKDFFLSGHYMSDSQVLPQKVMELGTSGILCAVDGALNQEACKSNEGRKYAESNPQASRGVKTFLDPNIMTRKSSESQRTPNQYEYSKADDTESLIASENGRTTSTTESFNSPMGEDEDEVSKMLRKADLLSKTIRSVANGQLNTPELLRASDAIFNTTRFEETLIATESTPYLLAKSKKFVDQSENSEGLGDISVDTFSHSMETNPVCNAVYYRLDPEKQVRGQDSNLETKAITPIPFQPNSFQRSDGVMERVIATLRNFPTSNTPDTSMPDSVALKVADSDDLSSVGSGSARSITRALYDLDTSYTTPNVEKSINAVSLDDSSRKSVTEAEELAKEMAQMLEETLLRSNTSMDKSVSSPPFNPRHVVNASPSVVSRELAKIDTWDEHDAVSLASNKFTPRKFVNDVRWETLAPVKTEDDDYVPIQDFRMTGSTVRSLGAGCIPGKEILKAKCSWRSKQKKFVRMAVVITLFISSALILKYFGLRSENDKKNTPIDNTAKSVRSALSNSKKKDDPLQSFKAKNIRFDEGEMSKNDDSLQKPMSEREAKKHEIKLEPIALTPEVKEDLPTSEQGAMGKTVLNQAVKNEGDSLKKIKVESEIVKQEAKLDIRKSKILSNDMPSSRPSKLQDFPLNTATPNMKNVLQQAIDTTPSVKNVQHTGIETSNMKNVKRKVIETPDYNVKGAYCKEKIPIRCYIPMSYIAFSRCQNFMKQRPLFNIQMLLDSMMQ
jgi:hypothetical protein